jgi:acetamidase/formamidase
MDNKELVAGTTLFIPVHAKGALFEVGDGHAGQGNGEVDITALETFLTGTFRFVVHKDQHLLWPRAETPTAYISMGFSPDLKEATTLAVRDMINFLVEQKHLSRDEAYMLTSVAVDVDITQLVDGNVGVHAMCPKAIFTSSVTTFWTAARSACSPESLGSLQWRRMTSSPFTIRISQLALAPSQVTSTRSARISSSVASSMTS